MQLASASKEAGSGAVFLAISPDSAENSRRLQQRLASKGAGDHGIRFLEDPQRAVIGRYGLLNPNGWGVPHPATYVVDPRGTVRYRFVETNHRIRAPLAEVIEALAEH